jgi:hypothetical protein
MMTWQRCVQASSFVLGEGRLGSHNSNGNLGLWL